MSDIEPAEFDQIMDDAPQEKEVLAKQLAQQVAAANRLINKMIPLDSWGEDWWDEPIEPLPSLLVDKNDNPVIPRGEVGFIIAPGGTGKTKLLMQLVCSLASGVPFQGSFKPKDNDGKILFFFGEEGVENIKRRFKQIHRSSKFTIDHRKMISKNVILLPLKGFYANFLNTNVELYDRVENQIIEVLEEVSKSGLIFSAVILDPLARFLPEEAEVDNAKATQFISICENFTKKEFGSPTVILSHHVKKDSIRSVKIFSDAEDIDQDASRGATGLTSGGRFVLSISTVKSEEWMENTSFYGCKILKTRHVKANEMPYMEPLLSYFDDTGVIMPLSDDDLKELKEAQEASLAKGNPKSAPTKTFQKRYGGGKGRQGATKKNDEYQCF